MERRMVGIAVVLGLVGLLAGNVCANMILNGGFEQSEAGVPYGSYFGDTFPVTAPNSLDHWGTSGGAGRWYGNYKNHTPGGNRCIATWDRYTYARQGGIIVSGGSEYTLSAWCQPLDWAAGVGGLLEIVWFAAGVDPTWDNYSQKISRQTVATYIPAAGDIGSWNYVEGTITAPANATGAVVVVGNKNGSGWTSGVWDDVSMVPEPVTMVLLASGAVFGVFRRKKV